MARSTTPSRAHAPGAGTARRQANAARRSYGEYCGVARGLDIIGDRWTLLLVRDLLLGPKRYKDLLEGLPGIGTNLLAHRLHELESLGLVERRVLPPPAGSAVYQLTEAGEALEPVVIAIGRWGGRYFLGAPRPEDVFVPSAYFVAMRSSFRPSEAADLRETYEFQIGGRVYTVTVEDGSCRTSDGPVPRPDAAFAMDVETLNGLLLEGLDPADAVSQGRITVEGDPRSLTRFVRMFAIHPPAPQPAAVQPAS